MKHDLSGRPRLVLAVAVVLALAGAVVVGLISGGRQRSGYGAAELVAYDSCASALDSLKEKALPHVGPYGLDNFGGEIFTADAAEGGAARAEAAPAAPDAKADAQAAEPAQGEQKDHSTTNNHEAAADEPDIVKTDGKRVVTVVDGRLRVVDVATREQTANLDLGGYGTQLLLSGDRALVVMGGGKTDGVIVDTAPRRGPATPTSEPGMPPETAPTDVAPPDMPTDAPATQVPPVDTPTTRPTDTPPDEKPGKPADPTPAEPTPTEPPSTGPVPKPMPFESRLLLVDLTGAGKILGTLDLDGGYLDARQTGTVARVVVRSQPRLEFASPTFDANQTGAVVANRQVVERSSIADWLPRYRLTVGAITEDGQLSRCEDMVHPVDYTANAMLTVLTFDLDKALGNGDPLTIVADGNTVYGTGDKLYVADDHIAHAGPLPGLKEPGNETQIYQFDVSGAGKPVHVASGAVNGVLLNQYSLSELDGNLRVATTIYDQSGSHSAISVLARRDNALTELGRVDGLGAGEQIYAVRYLGTVAYVVTFRQTDPLYTVDLSNPAAPKVTGELKITGYSAYLHPVGDGRLIGVGQEATTDGRRSGAQVALFDTADPAGAHRVAQYFLEGGYSDVEGDPHAFLYWQAKNLVVLPMAGGGVMNDKGEYADPMAGALVLRVTETGLEQAALISHPTGTPPRRTMVIGNELWTLSGLGMMVNDLDSFGQLAWVAFG